MDHYEPRQKSVRGDDPDIVRMYLADIGRHRLLSKDDEVRLAQVIEEGRGAAAEIEAAPPALTSARHRALRRAVSAGEAAQQTFVESNLRLVVSIAKKYQATGLPLLDLIQEGNLGLIHAVEMFDWRKGFKFSTYATWWIRQAITRGIANTERSIRLPIHVSDVVTRVHKAQAHLEQSLGRRPTLAEIGAEAGLPEAKVAEVAQFQADAVSLDDPVTENAEVTLGDLVDNHTQVTPLDALLTSDLVDEVTQMLRPLHARERQILALRFGLGGTTPRAPAEIGECLGFSRNQVRAIAARAMAKLRHPAAGVDVADLLGA